MLRIIFSLILLFLGLFSPWWAWFLVGVLGCFMFKDYFEFVILAIFSDLTFDAGFNFLDFKIHFLLTIVSLILLGVINFLKPRLRLGEKYKYE